MVEAPRIAARLLHRRRFELRRVTDRRLHLPVKLIDPRLVGRSRQVAHEHEYHKRKQTVEVKRRGLAALRRELGHIEPNLAEQVALEAEPTAALQRAGGVARVDAHELLPVNRHGLRPVGRAHHREFGSLPHGADLGRNVRHHQNGEHRQRHRPPHRFSRQPAPKETRQNRRAEGDVDRQNKLHDRLHVAHQFGRQHPEPQHHDDRPPRRRHPLVLRGLGSQIAVNITHKERRNREGLSRQRRHRAGQHARQHEADEAGPQQPVRHRTPHNVRVRQSADTEERDPNQAGKRPQDNHEAFQIITRHAHARGELIFRRTRDAHVVTQAAVLHDTDEEHGQDKRR